MTAAPRAALAKRRVQATLLVLVALLLVVLGTAIYATQHLYRSAERSYVKQALPLRTTMRDIVLQVANETTGVFGYVVTGDRKSLAPYFSGRFGAANDLATLTSLTRGRPELARSLREIRSSIDTLSAYFAREIAFAADGAAGRAQARRDVRTAAQPLRRFRQRASVMLTAVDRFVATTERAQRRTFWVATSTIAATGLLAIAIALALLRRVPERLRILYAAEEEARESAEVGANASRALAHTRDAVVLVDDEGIVRSWNTAAEWLFRLPPAAAVGARAEEVLRGLEVGDEDAAGERVRPITVAGEELWIAVTVTSFEGGRVLTIRDVTEDQALERARADFVATASHELRTPVASVYGAAQTILEHGDRLSTANRAKLLRMIEEESRRLSEIVDRILVSAQLDRGELAVAVGRCDLPELCRSVVASVAARHPGRPPIGLTVPSSIEPLETDPARVRQVLVNLVENAVRYTPADAPVDIRVLDDAARVRILVTDRGPGIPLAEQERIFEKFYRLDPQMTAGVGGSGLGLYISRQIVTALGGRLTVDSSPGKGATFTAELPRVSAQGRAAGGDEHVWAGARQTHSPSR